MAKDEDEAGYYSGIVAASMMAGRLVSSYAWGCAADKFGRRPVLMIGCLSIAVFSVMFGFSVNFTMALISRFLLGLFNGLQGTIFI